jgi:hypothetical protein
MDHEYGGAMHDQGGSESLGSVADCFWCGNDMFTAATKMICSNCGASFDETEYRATTSAAVRR